MSNSEPPDPLSEASGPPVTKTMGPTISGPSKKKASSSTLSRLESLPVEMVNKIGNHMELADLKLFRMTSKTMCKHLDFNMKEHFKVIKCRSQQVVFDALSEFKNQPLAEAVESLIWLKAPGPAGIDEQVEFERMMWKAGLLPELDEIFREEESRQAQDAGSEDVPPEMSDEEQQRLIAQSVIGLPNLRTLGLIFEEHPEDINVRPHDEDIKFWAEAVSQLERPLESLVQTEKGDFGVYWRGSRKSSKTLFFKTSHSVQNFNEEKWPTRTEIWVHGSFRKLFPVLGMLFGQGLKSLEFYRTSVLLEDIVYFCDHTRNLEEVKIIESAVSCWRSDFGVVTGEKSRFRKTVRRLTLSDCTLQPQDPDGLKKFFSNLRDNCSLEWLRFEKVGGLRFDWNNDGSKDNGARLPEIIDKLGIKGALTKMMQCFHVSAAPIPDFENLVSEWRIHRTFATPQCLPFVPMSLEEEG